MKQVSEALRLDASSTSRRVKVATEAGYIRNEQTRRGKASKLVEGDSMPEDIEVLPHPHNLKAALAVGHL